MGTRATRTGRRRTKGKRPALPFLASRRRRTRGHAMPFLNGNGSRRSRG